jgi:hypothetical protein
VSIKRTPEGGWQARWRDVQGKQRARTVRTRAQAEKLERRGRAERDAARAQAPITFDPLWRKVLRTQLDNHAAIEVEGFNPNGSFVYLLWDHTDDRPIYIGASRNILARLGNHLVDPDKRGRVGRVTLVRCYGPEAMAATEAKLIDFYKPELNLLDGKRRPVGRLPKMEQKSYVLPEAADLIGISEDALLGLIEKDVISATWIDKKTVLVPTAEIKKCMSGEIREGW